MSVTLEGPGETPSLADIESGQVFEDSEGDICLKVGSDNFVVLQFKDDMETSGLFFHPVRNFPSTTITRVLGHLRFS